MTKKIYEPLVTLKKMGQAVLYFGVPAILLTLLDTYPAIGSITIGAVVTGLANWLKNRS